MARWISCRVTQCCCCSLRVGVALIATLCFIDAILGFTGSAALFGGALDLLSVMAENGQIPNFGKIDNLDPRLHAGFIVFGVWFLITSILGYVAVCRNDVRAGMIECSFGKLPRTKSFRLHDSYCSDWLPRYDDFEFYSSDLIYYRAAH
jgi:hypothetical protein